MIKEVRRRAKKEGKSLAAGLLDIFYGETTKNSDRIAVAKLLFDKTVPQISEGGDTDKALGPAVFLPEHRPVLTVVEGGKS